MNVGNGRNLAKSYGLTKGPCQGTALRIDDDLYLYLVQLAANSTSRIEASYSYLVFTAAKSPEHNRKRNSQQTNMVRKGEKEKT